MDHYLNPNNIPYRHTYSSENFNGGQSSPSIEELPSNQSSFSRDVFSSRSFHGKPSTPQFEKLPNGKKFPRPGALRVQNLRQCSVNIDEYPNTQNFPKYAHSKALVNQSTCTDQGIINLGDSYELEDGHQYPDIQDYQTKQDLYNMRCAHFIDDSYGEAGQYHQAYLNREDLLGQDYYLQDVQNDTEDSVSNTDQQSDLYPPNAEND